MAKKFPIKPANPKRICWGCDKYCPADSLQCGNGSVATQHPSVLFGDDWMSWGLDAKQDEVQPAPPSPASAQESPLSAAASEQRDGEQRA
ncbi:MAG: DUF3079 domain-containing protein [Pelomonas sp.]|nr:DUF3079 domain-containing protein [Roseateles sp.]